jgi:hypothetical protein
VAGWLAGFPFTSAPVAVILTVEHGPNFTAGAATGTLLGVVSQAAFAFTYVWAARRAPWPVCLAAASTVFALCTAAFVRLDWPPFADAALAAAGLALALALLPARLDAVPGVRPPPWDLPVRMVVATGFVILITGVAAQLGPTMTGLLTPYPLYAAVLAVFAHVNAGAGSGAAVMRGLLAGLFGFGAFFLALALLVVPIGPIPAFVAAVASVCAVQLVALRLMRRGNT